jgi:hypothetical protein
MMQVWNTPGMTNSSIPATDAGQRSSPAPAVMWLPGAAFLCVGLWMVSGGGPLGLGWASVAIGLAGLVVGAVAQGVAWGMDIHMERHPSRGEQ